MVDKVSKEKKADEELIEAEVEFLRESFRGYKAMAVTFCTILFVITVIAFWYRNLFLGLLLLAILLIYKLCWAIFMVKKAKFPLMLILTAGIVIVAVLMLIF